MIKSEWIRNRYNRLVIFFLALISIAIGLFYTTDIHELSQGIFNIFVHHHRTDSSLLGVAGNTGSLWVNAGLIMLSLWLTYFLAGSTMKGIDIAAAVQMFGFSFYTLSLLAIWPTFFGALCEAKVTHKPIKDHLAIAWFTTALSPIVSIFSFHFSDSNFSYLLAFILGFILGFTSSFLAGYMKKLHKGRLLFNMGLTTGVVAWFFYNFIKYIGLGIIPLEDVPLPEYDWRPYFVFMLLAIYFILAGALYDGGVKTYFKCLFWTSTDGGDYAEEVSKGSAWINVGVLAAVALTLIAIVVPNGQLEDGSLAGVFTVAGFAAFGVTLRSWLPLYFTIYIASFFLGGAEAAIAGQPFIDGATAKLTSPGTIAASMHISGSSPIVKRDGYLPAILVALFHMMNTANTSALTGWMHAYNNGFSQGIVIVLFYPIWHYFSKRNTERINRLTP